MARLNGLHVPQIEKVDEFDQWVVWREHNGKREGIPSSSQVIAEENADYYRREGYSNVSIEKRHIEVIGEDMRMTGRQR